MLPAGPPRSSVRAEINVTPLVDVVLVLLIIFMVVAPLLEEGAPVRLPHARKSAEQGPEASALILSVTADHRIYVDQHPTEAGVLEGRLREILEDTPGRKILLRGDESLTVGEVRRVLDLAHRAGAKGVSLAVDEER